MSSESYRVTNNVGRVLQLLPIVEERTRDVVKGIELDESVLLCFEAYLRNSVAMYIASRIRRGEEIDIGKAISRVKKLLSRDRIDTLINICRLYRKLLLRRSRVIVDIGCGLGLNLGIARSYSDNSSLLIGIDKDLYFLRIAKGLMPGIDAVQADASMLPLRSRSIDLIFCTSVIHELPDLEAIDEFKRILRDGGKAFISDVVLRCIPSRILNLVRKLRVKLGMEPETFYTEKQLYSKIRLLGLAIEEAFTLWRRVFFGITSIVVVKPSRGSTS